MSKIEKKNEEKPGVGPSPVRKPGDPSQTPKPVPIKEPEDPKKKPIREPPRPGKKKRVTN